MKYHLGLGNNLGDRIENLARARARLVKRGIAIRALSALYETEPVGFSAQPWFINQAVEVETELSPRELLMLVKEIEKDMGREATVPDGPRVIDIDILLAEDTVIVTGELTVPHPRLAERNFVLVPLAEIAPKTVHPGLKRTIRELCSRSKDRAKIKLYAPARRGDS
ncbi:MAG: 2-amino-4-hydroxy-6-hydroxymethyldihydropteridine diphosphokinase [Candidatus Aminicenantes bacterium]|nr:2-amino-4-hydroxy-6-hydroxymethyldihydropteridine diphosphokinase [Candidatus Aminicenantes bacterium]